MEGHSSDWTDTVVDITRKRFDEIAGALHAHGQRRASPRPSRLTTWSSGSPVWAAWECGATWHWSREPGLPMATSFWTSRRPGPPRRLRVPRTPCPTSRVTTPAASSCPRRFSRGTWPWAWMCSTIGRRSYRVREIIPAENRSSLDRFQKQPERLRRAVERAGRLTASAHLRGGRFKPDLDRWPDLARWAAGPSLDALLAAAARFTERTNRQHAEFHAAIRDRGGISAALHAFAG